ncbi:hypothetical protein WUBG_03006 [Wuchereria bancrofti]|uniref:Uncharacterized protein n=1 Tax=Wuchereria bancrofti TaxID=6293 RepID=J9BFP9_WUCBA|nr:hypothetical protein WUBG_03006 [Wuchereria bancrofti]
MRKIEGNSALQYSSSTDSSERQSLVGKGYVTVSINCNVVREYHSNDLETIDDHEVDFIDSTTKSLYTGSTEREEDRAVKEQSISCLLQQESVISECPTQIIFKRCISAIEEKENNILLKNQCRNAVTMISSNLLHMLAYHSNKKWRTMQYEKVIKADSTVRQKR